MKNKLALTLAACTLCVSLSGCAGNVSTTDNGFVNGTNDRNHGTFYGEDGFRETQTPKDTGRSTDEQRSTGRTEANSTQNARRKAETSRNRKNIPDRPVERSATRTKPGTSAKQ